MPQAAQHYALARLWEMLKRLPSRAPGITARELVDQLNRAGFTVTKRAVERDLVELASVFGIECRNKGTPFGWYWMRGQGAELPALTVADAVSTRLVEELLTPLLPPAILEPLHSRFEHARHKLSDLALENKAAAWPQKVRYVQPSLPMVAPIVDAEVLHTVQKALMDNLQLVVTYQRPSGTTSEGLVLHPQALVQRGQITYVVATAYEYDDVRLYALHRMTKAEINFNACHQVPDFDLDAYLQAGALQFESGEAFKLEARVDADLAGILKETPLSLDQTLDADVDGFRLAASVQDTWQLWWWLLSQGASIRVTSPESLLERIKAHTHQMVDCYLDPHRQGNISTNVQTGGNHG
jgi:predicted DNA-binding transcriptional regulator YafY